MKGRLFYIDATRACACLLVVTSHVFAPVCAGMNSYSRATWWMFNLFDSVIRPSAAIFIMLSGVLFLGSSKNDSYLTFVWKRYAKLLPPFVVWSFIYAYWSAWSQEVPFDAAGAFGQMLREPAAYHLWFMYIILALYLVMPVLRLVVRRATPAALGLLLALWMGHLVREFQAVAPAGQGPLSTFVSYAGYAVLGYALSRADGLERSAHGWGALWLGIVLFNAAATYWLTLRNDGVLDEKFYFGASPLVALQAATMFMLFKGMSERSVLFRTSWLRRAIHSVSQHSYNIYLSHALFIALFTNGTLSFILSEKTGPHPAIGVGLTTSAVLAGSFGLSLLAARVPILSRLLILPPPRGSSLQQQ